MNEEDEIRAVLEDVYRRLATAIQDMPEDLATPSVMTRVLSIYLGRLIALSATDRTAAMTLIGKAAELIAQSCAVQSANLPEAASNGDEQTFTDYLRTRQ